VAGLEKPVTLTETKISLGELVAKVAAETGVALTAHREVADEPVLVIVKELPARELLEQLAELLDYRWSRRATNDERRTTNDEPRTTNDGGKRSSSVVRRSSVRYEIRQDLASKQREEALRRGAIGEVQKRFEEEMALVMELAAMPEERLQAIREQTRTRFEALGKLSEEERAAITSAPEFHQEMRRMAAAQRLASPVPRALAGLVGRLSPEQWASLREGRALTLSTEPQEHDLPMPAELERLLRATKPTIYPAGTNIRYGDSTQEEQVRQREKQMQEQWAAASGFRVSIRMDANRLGSAGSMNLNADARPFRNGAPGGGASYGGGGGTSLGIYASANDGNQRSTENTPERRAALAQDPVLSAKQVFKPDLKPRTEPGLPSGMNVLRLPDILPEIARVFAIHVIGDAYGNTSSIGIPSTWNQEPIALHTLLDRYAAFSYRWDRRDSVIRLRSRTWHMDRRREIPLRLSRVWLAEIAEKGGLSLERMLEIATTLSDVQIENMYSLQRDSRSPAFSDLFNIQSARHALRLLAALPPQQRAALLRGGTLPVARMAPAQRARFLAAIQERNRNRVPPVHLEQWLLGSLTTRVQEGTRITERVGDSTRVRYEMPPPPGAAAVGPGPAGPGALVAGSRQALPAPPTTASPAPAAPAPPLAAPSLPPADSVTRQPIRRIWLELEYAPNQKDTYVLTLPVERT